MRDTAGSARGQMQKSSSVGTFHFEPPSRFTSFDDLVGAGEHSRWDFEAERLGCFDVYDQFELGRLLHGQVSRFLALEDAIDVAGGASVLVDRIRPIGEQAATGDVQATTRRVDRGQPVPRRQRDYEI